MEQEIPAQENGIEPKMEDGTSVEPSLMDLCNALAEEMDADVILYNGPLTGHSATQFTRELKARRRRKNAFLLLVTYGGDASAAYRIARLLQEKYDRFMLYASGYCKSAGTIVAVGAHELIMSDYGELGPLDVQMGKRDEILGMQSGLTIMDTLTTLHQKALDACEVFFLNLSFKSHGSITLKTATDVATAMTTGLFAPLYSQIDPLVLGEAGRAMRIADSYGRRLLLKGQNITPLALEKMLNDYPSHGFVIDRLEAETLFENVRGPRELEERMADMLGDRALFDLNESENGYPAFFLSDEPADPHSGNDYQQVKGANHETSDTPESEPGEDVGTAGARLTDDGRGERGDVEKGDVANTH